MLKAETIREMADDEIRTRIAELEEERFRLRFRSATEAIDSPLRFRVLRRDVARLKTIQRERALGVKLGGVVQAEPAEPATTKRAARKGTRKTAGKSVRKAARKSAAKKAARKSSTKKTAARKSASKRLTKKGASKSAGTTTRKTARKSARKSSGRSARARKNG